MDKYEIYRQSTGELVGVTDYNPLAVARRKRYEWAMMFCMDMVKDKRVSHVEVRVFLFLSLAMDAGGLVYGSVKSLAADLGMDAANMSRYINRLCESGYIRKTIDGLDERIQVLPAYAHKGKLVVRNRLNAEILKEELSRGKGKSC